MMTVLYILQVRRSKWSVPSLASTLPTSHALLACSIKTLLRRPCCRRLTRLNVHTRRGGVQNDSGMELRPEIMDGISPADPKRSSTQVYHTSRRIISHPRKSQPVKLSSMLRVSNVKAQGACGRVYRAWFRENFLGVSIRGSHKALVV
jgi:hypothetical protein